MGLPDLAPEERRALQAARKREKHAARAALKEIDPRLAKVREQKCPTPLRHGQPWTADVMTADAYAGVLQRDAKPPALPPTGSIFVDVRAANCILLLQSLRIARRMSRGDA